LTTEREAVMARRNAKGAQATAAVENEVSENGAAQPEAEFKGFAEYKLAGDIPDELKGKTVRTREFRDLDHFREGVQDGDPKHITRLAQAQYDIIVQRKIREAIQNAVEEAQSKEADEKISETAQAVRAGDWDAVHAAAQSLADSWVYGSRPASTGEATKARKAVKTVEVLNSAAAADPELAAKLAALGITLS
jgi:hypothetical protein